MKKILLSILSVGVVGAVAFSATQAFFSDTETSTGNTFTAGEIDLTVDSTAHYAGMVCTGGFWVNETTDSSTRPDLLGDECFGTWTATDLTNHSFFNYGDLKPGDEGENTLSLTVTSNDSYACAVIGDLEDLENDITEPEAEDGDTTPDLGELSSELRFFAWDDNGNNVWESGEAVLFSNIEGPASDVVGGVVYPLFTPASSVLPANTTQYLGMYWCYGDITANEGDHTLTCDGSDVTNVSQTDSMSADIAFYVEQSRNNEDFTCSEDLLSLVQP